MQAERHRRVRWQLRRGRRTITLVEERVVNPAANDARRWFEATPGASLATFVGLVDGVEVLRDPGEAAAGVALVQALSR